jgi:hypothetical protein
MAPGAAALNHKLGGISFIGSGALFLIKSVLDLLVGDPPSTGSELLAWKTSHQLPLALANELLIFAAVLLIPALLALYRSLDGSDSPWVGFGCGLFAVVIPVILVLAMVHGRLMYPVYGIKLDDPGTLALVVSLYYGGAHEVSLLLGGALIILGLVMRRGIYGRAVGVLGVTAGVFQIVGAYPWLIGPILGWITQLLIAAWLILTGSKLMRLPQPVTPTPARSRR